MTRCANKLAHWYCEGNGDNSTHAAVVRIEEYEGEDGISRMQATVGNESDRPYTIHTKH